MAPQPSCSLPGPDEIMDFRRARRRFIKFILLAVTGFVVGYLSFRKGFALTPQSFKQFVLGLGAVGPLIYVGIFVIRPLFLIPSIALFIAGGLAFGPFIGPVYASLGAGLGGALGFWVARYMGQDYVMRRLKLGSQVVENTRFSFSVVFLLSLLPVMPVTAINYGAGLSRMSFKNYLVAHVLGITPRAFAYGFFGSTLLEIGSPRFRIATSILVLLAIGTVWFRIRSKYRREKPALENNPA